MSPTDITTTCRLCGVALEIRSFTSRSGVVRFDAWSITPHPSDPNNNYANYCKPDGPGHERADLPIGADQ